MFGFLIFIIIERNFMYNSLYILTERSSKHLCSIRAWVPVSFFLPFSPSLSLANTLEHRNPSCSLSCPNFQDPLERVPCTFVSDASPVSRSLLVLCINQGISASFSLSLPYRQLWTIRFRSTKGPQQSPLTDGRYRKKGLSGLHEVCCRRNILCCLEPLRFSDLLITAAQLALLVNIVTKPNLGPLVQLTVKSIY